MATIKKLLKHNPGSVLIDEDNTRTGILYRHAQLLKNPNAWHAFILYNVNRKERNAILKIVLDHLYPLDLIPVKFEVLGNDCLFMARNCTEAIEKLCKDNLLIPNNLDPMSPIKCNIILQYSTLHQIKVDVQKNITSIMHSLYNSVTKTLDLDNFSANPELTEYCPLSQPKIMYFVLHIAVGFHPIHIKLTNNEIHSLYPIEALWGSSTLTQLDLRNNRIDSYSNLDALKMLPLTELWLDGNPFCNDLDEYKYVEEIKKYLPKLARLDGVQLQICGIPANKKDSLCNNEGFDLVDQFLEYYFQTYDNDRKSLENLYGPNAMCSITNTYKTSQISSSSARLRPYQMNSRNLLCMADISRSQQYLIKGNGNITRKLMDLPRTEHDPYSFSVDLSYYLGRCAIINISGVFREIPEALLEPDKHLGFFRTFVLTGSNNEYSIVNDMLHVYNALTHQSTKAFNISKPIKNQMSLIPLTSKDKEKTVQAVDLITGVSSEWSKRFLEKTNYDIAECIRVFVEQFKAGNIPKEAFR